MPVLTPYEMAAELLRAGWQIPPYPEPISRTETTDSAAASPLCWALFFHLCDAWEWQIQCLHAARAAHHLQA